MSIAAGTARPYRPPVLLGFWSVDRNDYVPADDVRIGETLKTLEGTTVVESRSKREEPETVYNIEVEGDHVYRVGESGVLVHNASDPECMGRCAELDEDELFSAMDPDDLELHGEPTDWTYMGQKQGSGQQATSDNASPGTVKCFDIYDDAYGNCVEVHYFSYPDGTHRPLILHDCT